MCRIKGYARAKAPVKFPIKPLQKDNFVGEWEMAEAVALISDWYIQGSLQGKLK